MTVKSWEMAKGTKRRKTQRVEERIYHEELMVKLSKFIIKLFQLNVDNYGKGQNEKSQQLSAFTEVMIVEKEITNFHDT